MKLFPLNNIYQNHSLRFLTTILFLLLVVVCYGKIQSSASLINWPDSLVIYDKHFQKRNSQTAPKNKNWFEYRSGTRRILITAPHSTAQTRKGEIKQAETGTGALALALHKATNAAILFTTYISPSDPNYYDKNSFKDTLSVLLKILKPDFVLDLHGAHPDREFDVDFGTIYGQSYLDRKIYLDSLKAALKSYGISRHSRDFFSAGKQRTITRFIYLQGIPCLQLEVNSNYLMPDNGKEYKKRTERLFKSLRRFIENNF